MSIVLMGSTSGSITLQEPAVAGSTTINLPATSGTAVVGSAAVSAAGQIPFSTDGSTYTPTAKIVSATAVASTSGTSIDFTSIPSWVKRITVMFSGVSTNGTSVPWLVQIGPSGGAETTGYLGATSSLSTGVGSTNSTAGFPINADNSATTLLYGNMTIVNITGSTWVASGTFGQSDRAYTILMGANKTITGTLAVVRVTTTGGTNTFDAGTINILYE